ncbi:MAG TPA: PQQ-binding-like beta-propeller repeat protein [Gemmataceae bacterium]|nr:PQQ-binding-like beta-propeller repeat protein [Gemmataceae bacterium]
MLRNALFFLSVLTAAATADDWPQWQGPDRNAVSKEKGLLQEWPTDGPPLAWKAKGFGGGDSAPSVAGGKLFGMSNRGDDEVVWSLSEADGKELWVTRLGPAFQQRVPQSKEGPSCTPTVDGERLYVLGVGGDQACLQVKDGNILWRVSLTKDFGGIPPMWNFRESPLADGDKVVCTPGAPDATIVALNKATGKTIWKSKMPAGAAAPAGGPGGRPGKFGPSGGAAYSSAIAVDFAGQRQYVQLTAKALVGVAAADGKIFWRFDKPANGMGINCSTPLFHDDQVFAASAYGAGGGLVKLSADKDGGIKTDEVYFTRQMQNHHGGMIRVDDSLYGANGGNGGGYLTCLDFQTGKVLWDTREDDRKLRKGSQAMADGRLYYRTEEGPVLLVEPSKEKYIERGRFAQPDRTRLPAWAPRSSPTASCTSATRTRFSVTT